jgi:hypothetical protein
VGAGASRKRRICELEQRYAEVDFGFLVPPKIRTEETVTFVVGFLIF